MLHCTLLSPQLLSASQDGFCPVLAPPPLTPSALATNVDLKDLLSKKVLKHSCRVGQQKGYRCLPLAKPDRPVSSLAYLSTAGLNHQPQGNLPVSAPKSSGSGAVRNILVAWPLPWYRQAQAIPSRFHLAPSPGSASAVPQLDGQETHYGHTGAQTNPCLLVLAPLTLACFSGC